MGVHTDAAGFLATLVKWFVRLIVLVTAFDALGLPAVSQVLQQILLWLPNLVVGNPDLLATIARVAVWAFALVIVRDWYERGRQAAPRMALVANAASMQPQSGAGTNNSMPATPMAVNQPGH